MSAYLITISGTSFIYRSLLLFFSTVIAFFTENRVIKVNYFTFIITKEKYKTVSLVNIYLPEWNRIDFICNLSSWFVCHSVRCLNSWVRWRQWDIFSGETKSSAIFIQLWRFLTWWHAPAGINTVSPAHWTIVYPKGRKCCWLENVHQSN